MEGHAFYMKGGAPLEKSDVRSQVSSQKGGECIERTDTAVVCSHCLWLSHGRAQALSLARGRKTP